MFLGCAIATIFFGVLSNAKTFYYSDFLGYTHPIVQFYRASILSGRVPLWNPFSNCGLPFLGQWNTQVLYPPSLIYCLLPLPWAINLTCILHLEWAGIGMYLLAFCYVRSEIAAGFAGVVYALNGLMVQSLIWPDHIASLAWMPWVVLSAQFAILDGSYYVPLCAVAGALQVYSGSPEIVIFTWGIIGVFWLVYLVKPGCRRKALAARFSLIILWTTALSAAQLLPVLELLFYSQRDSGFAKDTNSLPVYGVLNCFIPFLHSYMSADGCIFLAGQRYFRSCYVGMTSALFIFVCVLKKRSREVMKLGFITIVSFALAMGDHSPAYKMLRFFVPLIGFIRYPVKFIMIAIFAMPLLSAYGIAWLTSNSSVHRDLRFKTLVRVAMGTVFLIIGVMLFAWMKRDTGDDAIIGFSSVQAHLWLMIASCWCLYLAVTARRQISQLAEALFLLITVLDLAVHVPQLAPSINRLAYQSALSKPIDLEQAPLQLGAGRALSLDSEIDWSPSVCEGILKQQQALSMDLNLLKGLQKVDGFFPLCLRRVFEINTAIESAPIHAAAMCDFLGVGRIDDQDPPNRWRTRGSAMPLLTVGQGPVYLADSNALQFVTGGGFQPRQYVCLGLEAKQVVTASLCTNARIVDSAVEVQRVSASVEAPKRTMFVVAQSHYRCWHAYVDGSRVPLWRANYAFQAVEVPAGSHRILIVYEDRLFIIGGAISLLCCMFTTFILVRRWWYHGGAFIISESSGG